MVAEVFDRCLLAVHHHTDAIEVRPGKKEQLIHIVQREQLRIVMRVLALDQKRLLFPVIPTERFCIYRADESGQIKERLRVPRSLSLIRKNRHGYLSLPTELLNLLDERD
ncbi:MAG: hypothetical protein HOY79_51305 [Streptomyces sp.]|nr:hypothetical protein [Streptomyces sp.]